MMNNISQINNLQKIGILWFRNDLRLHDNLILNQTIESIKEKKIDFVIPFFCYDIDQIDGFSREAKIERCGPIRRNFIIECVDNLKSNLIKNNITIDKGGVSSSVKNNQCDSSNNVAIIIPYRDRLNNLLIWLNNMHIFLDYSQKYYFTTTAIITTNSVVFIYFEKEKRIRTLITNIIKN